MPRVLPESERFLSIPMLAERWAVSHRTARRYVAGSHVLLKGVTCLGESQGDRIDRTTRVRLSAVLEYESARSRVKSRRVVPLKLKTAM